MNGASLAEWEEAELAVLVGDARLEPVRSPGLRGALIRPRERQPGVLGAESRLHKRRWLGSQQSDARDEHCETRHEDGRSESGHAPTATRCSEPVEEVERIERTYSDQAHDNEAEQLVERLPSAHLLSPARRRGCAERTQ